MTGGRWRRIVLGDVLAKHVVVVVELRGRARVWPGYNLIGREARPWVPTFSYRGVSSSIIYYRRTPCILRAFVSGPWV